MAFLTLDRTAATVIPATGFAVPKTGIGLTLADMEAELRSMIGNRDDISATRLRLWINLAYVDLVTALDLESAEGSIQFTTVAGESLYRLPAEVAAIHALAAINPNQVEYPEYGGHPLDPVTKEDYRMLPEMTGEVPGKYFRQDDLLIIYPEPETAVDMVMDFVLRPDFMANDTDSPILPVEWHEGILLGARKKVFRVLLEPALAAEAANDYTEFIRDRRDPREADDKFRKPSAQPISRQSQLRRKPYRKKEW